MEDSSNSIKFKISNIDSNDIIKLTTTDQNGVLSFPLFHVIEGNGVKQNSDENLIVEKDFYGDFIRLKVIIPGVADFSPNLFVQQIGNPPTEITLNQIKVNEFIGVYPLVSGKNGPLSIYASIKNESGNLCKRLFEILKSFHS